MPAPQSVIEIQPESSRFLEKLLHARLPSSGLLWNMLKLKQGLNGSNKISVKIFADEREDAWSDDTTFMGVSNVKGLPPNLVVFSGPREGSSKSAVLRVLSVLDWKRPNQFEGVDNFIAPVLLEEARQHGILEEHDPIELFYMSDEEALNIFNEKDVKALSSSSLRGDSLQPSDAIMVQDRWPVKREGYLQMLQASIELCSSGGIYLSKNNINNGTTPTDHHREGDLVSFAVALPFGSIHALHTEPEQRRKGYGKLAMKVLVRNVAKAGRVPLVQIYKTNDGSKALNLSIGFKYSHDINLIHFTPV